MKYEECKDLDDIAQALNEDNDAEFDIFAYQEAVERIGAIDTGDEVYWAFHDLGNGRFARLWNCGDRFVVDEVDGEEVPDYVIA